ncbi:MAG: hypothetical protein AAF517_21885, partial [Planctomycetota bacterium]
VKHRLDHAVMLHHAIPGGGTGVKLHAVSSDGTRRPLLSVPRFHAELRPTYRWKAGVELKTGETLSVAAG